VKQIIRRLSLVKEDFLLEIMLLFDTSFAYVRYFYFLILLGGDWELHFFFIVEKGGNVLENARGGI